ncbi:MAG: hypothetical protein KAT17_01570 [Candidatus Aminicenantes bacterium]|nr:hypothetical protein [Candidatus Aminicenantes bacterium]
MPEKKNHSFEDFISANKEIDVNAIMESIIKKIEEKKKSGVLKQSEIDEINEMELLPLPDFQEVPSVYEDHLFSRKLEENLILGYEIEKERRGLFGIIKKIMQKTRRLFLPLIRFAIRPALNDMARLYGENIFKSKEYIRILHNALTNMITESSKLKIEEEMLKTKIKVLEDRMAFLENRERAIEKKVFQ